MEAPRLPSIFKQNQPRRFEFTPRYYDERKERLEEMRRKYAQKSTPENYSSSSFRMQMGSEWRRPVSSKSSRGTNLRLVVIALILFLVTYLILFY